MDPFATLCFDCFCPHIIGAVLIFLPLGTFGVPRCMHMLKAFEGLAAGVSRLLLQSLP